MSRPWALTTPALQPVQALTRLSALQLGGHLDGQTVEQLPQGLLQDVQHLSRLELRGMGCEPADALAGKTRLQHLSLIAC